MPPSVRVHVMTHSLRTTSCWAESTPDGLLACDWMVMVGMMTSAVTLMSTSATPSVMFCERNTGASVSADSLLP